MTASPPLPDHYEDAQVFRWVDFGGDVTANVHRYPKRNSLVVALDSFNAPEQSILLTDDQREALGLWLLAGVADEDEAHRTSTVKEWTIATVEADGRMGHQFGGRGDDAYCDCRHLLDRKRVFPGPDGQPPRMYQRTVTSVRRSSPFGEGEGYTSVTVEKHGPWTVYEPPARPASDQEGPTR